MADKRVFRGPTFTESKLAIAIVVTGLLLWLIFTVYMTCYFGFPKGTLTSPPFRSLHLR